jgi:hypothetical protein
MRVHITGLLSAALCLSLVGCGDGESAATAEVKKAEPTCTIGKAVPPTELALNSSIEIRKTPNGEKIKNEKASGILEKTIYHSIDNSTTVKQLCAEGDWTQVQITSPDWLTHVKGWAPNSAFRNIERSTDGTRVFVEADVYWDKDTSPHKKRIVEEINRISRTKGCSDLDPATVALSPSKSTPTKKVFFVTCGFTSTPFNVWFEL